MHLGHMGICPNTINILYFIVFFILKSSCQWYKGGERTIRTTYIQINWAYWFLFYNGQQKATKYNTWVLILSLLLSVHNRYWCSDMGMQIQKYPSCTMCLFKCHFTITSGCNVLSRISRDWPFKLNEMFATKNGFHKSKID